MKNVFSHSNSCCSVRGDKPNLIAVGAVSHACADPPMLGTAIGHTRHSYNIISGSRDFVVNVPSKTQAKIVDYCGTFSGKRIDKFKACNLTPLPSTEISSPAILEFPINIECATRKSVDLGSHTFFFGEIVTIRCDIYVLDDKGQIDKEKLEPMCAFLEDCWSLGDAILKFS